MISEAIDNLVAIFSPGAAAKRVADRATFDAIKSRRLEAGKRDRLTNPWVVKNQSGENSSRAEVSLARDRAWDLFWNNAYARKAVRGVVSQVIGCGLKPESQATKPNGDPYEEFRNASKQLWKFWSEEVGFDQAACLALQETMLSGEVLFLKDYSEGGIIPYRLHLVESERLIDDDTFSARRAEIGKGNYLYRGIEFTPQGSIAAYHLYEFHPQDPRPTFRNTKIRRYVADDVIHLFLRERPSQIRGTTWFAPAVLQLRDIKDYQENELVAAAVGACVVAGVTRKSGSGAFPGLNTPSSASATDADGNTITRMQPGMLLDLREGEKIEGFNPQRPNSQAEAFITHLLRSVAASLPGLKSSTITGDYRSSSFSSEKSADNDAWREVEQIQDWLVASLMRPVWADVISYGVLSGYFSGLDLRTFKSSDFSQNRQLLLQATWSGPVAKSINPTDDETASELAIKTGTSSLPIECAARGLNWEDVLEDQKKVMEKRKELGIPDPAQMEADALKAKIQPKPNDQQPKRLNGVLNGSH